MKKRLLALLLALMLLLALTACGGGEKNDAADDAAQEDTLPEDTEQEETDSQPEADAEADETDGAVTAVDTEEGEEEQAQEPQIGQRPADTNEKPQTGGSPADSNEKPVSKPVEQPEQKPVEQPASTTRVDLAAFAADLASSQTDWPGMMALEGESLDAYYSGLSALSPKQCVVQMAMISASGVEIALVEAASSADVETIKGIFQARIDYQVGDGENPGGAWYPEPTEMWKNNSRIVANGNYVMLVAFENADSVVDSFNALFA